jgi:outer membrane PBP1 activator LpoA protein
LFSPYCRFNIEHCVKNHWIQYGTVNVSSKKATRSVPLLLAALIFAGCGTQAPDQSTAHLQGSAQADSGFYLQQMSQSSNDTKTNWQLLAIRALLKEENPAGRRTVQPVAERS